MRAIESETVQHLLAELPEYGTRFNELNDDAEGELDPFEAASALASWMIDTGTAQIESRTLEAVEHVYTDSSFNDGGYLAVEFFEALRVRLGSNPVPASAGPATRRWFAQNR